MPFAARLAEALAGQPTEPRVGRDFARLLSLVKAAALLRHSQRACDGGGRLLADVADYALVYELAGEVYRSSASGAGEKVRQVVGAVARLTAAGKPHVSVSQVAAELALSAMAASRRVRAALRSGWLTNAETRKGHPYQLSIGEPLPAESGLPAPEAICPNTVTPNTDATRAPAAGGRAKETR